MRRRLTLGRPQWISALLIVLALVVAGACPAFAQQDQGAVTGTITDPTGAAVPNASVTITNVDTGLVLNATTDASGNYTFSPIKIGNYKVSATAPGFSTTTQSNIRVDVQSRVEVNVKLNTGAATTTVEVNSAPPLMQTQEGSTGQVMDTKTINDTPLNGRNWVFIAQLTAGAAPPSGSRGAGKGDFNANGQRAEQNNFILDGVDNNNNVVDFLNGASFIVNPPPDALAEFKVQTGAYSAEFGHSAGAVINASVKSGTNQIHGDLWEYVRNDAFDVHEYFGGPTVPKYRQNQFGATLGFPIIKDKLFFFGDVQATRIIFGETHSGMTVPTALMRNGDFSELLNGANNSGGTPITLYQPSTTAAGLVPLSCNGRANVMCANQIDPVAQHLLSLFPNPNVGGVGKTYSNFTTQSNATDNTWQWDTRMDWNISAKDQLFGRFSYWHEPANHPAPLGPILDGGGFGDTGAIVNLGENFAGSETHVFSPTLVNEFRFGYNYGHFGFFHENSTNPNLASSLGLGGIPVNTSTKNDGIPFFSISGLSNSGSPQFYASNEYENVFQILDNVTKQLGNHSLRAGVNFQRVRRSTSQPTQPRGTYTFNGVYTSQPGTSNTGFGAADFLFNTMNSAAISNVFNTDEVRWDRSAYVQDDWKVTPKLTLNLGVRYEYFQPFYNRHDQQAVFVLTGPLKASAGIGKYLLPESQRNVPLAPKFTQLLAKDNIALEYTGNRSLIEAQKYNFAPRFGFAYTIDPKTVIRGGYGMFYGGLESTGYFPDLGENYPFEFDSSFNSPSGCTKAGACPTNGFTLETGFPATTAAGLAAFINTPNLRGSDAHAITPYAQDYNLTVERGITNDFVATIGYVGSLSRHLQVFPNPNGATALAPHSFGSPTPNPLSPFPDFGVTYTSYTGSGNYNSLQTKLERRFHNGLNFLATYTWSHSMDDAPTPLGSTGDPGFRNTNIVPAELDYASSPFDVRHRFTFNGSYQLPFGRGQKYVTSGLLDYVVGGWSTSLTFQAQTGEPFTVYSSNITSPSGAGVHANRIADPFKGGGTFDPQYLATFAPGSPLPTCPTKVRTVANWYNPCAFRNPKADDLGTNGVPTNISGAAALPYLGSPRNQINGPGYDRINMSLFKSFRTWREQNLQFRADAFNLLNTPAYGEPSQTGVNSNGGQITGARFFQNYTPDSRFFQFALKYNF
jgi:hypothetical protein